MSEQIILEISHLKKAYGKDVVLEDVTFQIKEGHILGLIGKNGAGKTTLMKSILGLNVNYQGEILFQGKTLSGAGRHLKSKIGSLVDVTFYEDMTASENLRLAMMLTEGLKPSQYRSREKELLEFVGLTKAAKKSVKSFSFGMKQRLALAQALITNPVLLILDEPFVGLDPIGIEDTKEMLQNLCRTAGTSILFSSHQLGEVCDIADDIVVLNHGEITYSDTYQHLKNSGLSLVELMK